MKLKRFLSGLLAAAVALSAMSLTPLAAVNAADVVASGIGGYNSVVTWTLDSDGVCTLSGSGTAESLSDLVSNYGTDIKEIIFEDGFTIIGGYIFRNLTELRKVTIKGNTLTKIYGDVFSGCTSLEEIYIYPKYINSIEISSFDTSNNPVFYTYLGSTTENCLLKKGFTNIGNIEDPSQVTGDAADLTKLLAAIVSANNYYSGMYTEESYQLLADALAAGNELRFNESAAQDEVDAAAAAITSAISNLVEADVITNVCGNDVTWTLDKTTGLMTISGTGAMYQSTPNAVYTGCTSWGYYKYADKIKEVVVEEGVTSIGGYAFGTTSHTTLVNAFPNLTKITLPSTIELIAEGAFKGSLATNLVVPENVTEIAASAYSRSQIENVELKEGMTIGGMAFAYCDYLKEVTIPGNITWIQSGGHTDNSPASQFIDSGVEKVTILGGGTVVQRFGTYENGIPGQMFERCKSLKEVIIKCDDLSYITSANSSSEYTSETFETLGTNITYYVYRDTTTETTLRNAGYITDDNVVYITNFSDLTKKITEAEAIDTSLYTDDSVKTLTDAIAAAKTVKENAEAIQADVDAAVKVIDDAIVGLTYKPADYSAVEAAKAKVPADLSIYTDETAQVVTDAVAAVVYDLDISHQTEVDAWAKAIEDAIEGLKLKPTGGNVSGTINVSDKNAETEMTVTAVAEDGTKTTVKATSMGTYKFENLAAGDYTLTISGGKYAPRSYEIKVAEGEIAQDVELNPYGDINGDGKITTADVGMANSHAKGVSILEDYKFVCADVKIDGSITTADVGMINSHAKGVKVLW